MATTDMKCPNCMGEMINKEAEGFYECPFCGSKQMLVESEAIKKKRLENEAQKKELEAEDIRHQREQEYDLKKEEINSTVKGIKETAGAINSGVDLINQGNQMINKAEQFIGKVIMMFVLGVAAIVFLVIACNLLT